MPTIIGFVHCCQYSTFPTVANLAFFLLDLAFVGPIYHVNFKSSMFLLKIAFIRHFTVQSIKTNKIRREQTVVYLSHSQIISVQQQMYTGTQQHCNAAALLT